MKKVIFFLMIVAFCSSAQAEQKVTQGNYELHFTTFPSTFLDTKIATTHGIKRSKNRGILSITVMDLTHHPAQATTAAVKIKATNILGQNKTINLKYIKENDGGVYYLGLFKMNHEENVTFEISAKPTGSTKTINHKFSREFFTD